jgi:two-component system, chemotaxis family, CheB/CheR fusion protein
LLEAYDRSQSELRAVTAALLTAQDDECRRIARELHDDVLQRLAVLELGLGKLKASRPQEVRDIDALSSQLAAVSRDVRNLSHGLHPSLVEDLGLESALRTLCEEFERSYNLAARCVCSQLQHPAPPPTATTIYRIAQEAVRNVGKHAGDARVTLTLCEMDMHWVLTIQDDGCGFNPIAERPRSTLGLISIQERAKLVGGHVDIVSAQGDGTTIQVTIPFS